VELAHLRTGVHRGQLVNFCMNRRQLQRTYNMVRFVTQKCYSYLYASACTTEPRVTLLNSFSENSYSGSVQWVATAGFSIAPKEMKRMPKFRQMLSASLSVKQIF